MQNIYLVNYVILVLIIDAYFVFLIKIGGVCVSFQQKDSASILSFSPYFEGAAPVRIENYCSNISMVSYKQR